MNRILKLSPILLTALYMSAQKTVSNSYTVTNLSSDIPGMAATTDSNLVNPWGLSRPASSSLKENEWWAADQVTGVSTLYDANGAVVPLTVTIPSANGTSTGSPTGTVYASLNFVFVTLDGTISQWVSGTAPNGNTSVPKNFVHPVKPETCTGCHVTNAVLKVNHSSLGASYTGVTVASNAGAQTFYVANSNGGIEAYDSNFNPVTLAAGAFTDINIPAGYTPQGIQAVGQRIYVTYNPQDPATGGYVDAFSPAGALLLTLQTNAPYNQPWGIAQAPSNFGAFSSTLLVGNNGSSGTILAFNPKTGKYVGTLKNSSGQSISIPGLWGLSFGDGNTESGPTSTLYFNAGIDNSTHGLFGAIASTD